MKHLSWKLAFAVPLLITTAIFTWVLYSMLTALPADDWSKGKLLVEELSNFKTYHYTGVQTSADTFRITYSVQDDLIVKEFGTDAGGLTQSTHKGFAKDINALYVTKIDKDLYYYAVKNTGLYVYRYDPTSELFEAIAHHNGPFNYKHTDGVTLSTYSKDDAYVFYEGRIIYHQSTPGFNDMLSTVIDNTLYIAYTTDQASELMVMPLSGNSDAVHTLAEGLALQDVGHFSQLKKKDNTIVISYNLADDRNGISYLGVLLKQLDSADMASNHYSRQTYSNEPVLIEEIGSGYVVLTFSTRTEFGWNTVEATLTESGLTTMRHLSNDKRLNKSVLRFKMEDYDYMLWLDYNTVATNIMVSSNHPKIIKDSIEDTDVSLKRMVSSVLIVFIGSLLYGSFLAGSGLLCAFAVLFGLSALKRSPALIRLATMLAHLSAVAYALITKANPDHSLAEVFPELFSSNAVLFGVITILALVAYLVSQLIVKQRAIKDNIGKYMAFGLTFAVYINFGIAVYITLFNVIGKI
ncbi:MULTISPECIES: hypothetical protein [unclassified Fusibacter]|uniref:hypothetical protein n=1 Tax=unclassified Fusibacter TaxID=2624464 RepID=UPI0010110548|nr:MULTISPECIES: hypothetical protein [unclassified Fusibacter]MCK8059705.1 hypothetical protein [Fusibacter sp. A2]NPE21506.1 hypothetical protein [Fusibacter sp. A1]RXV61916.1 hypothetical protein DWB64_06665 [Fusibacter sp. A1]